MSKTTINTNLRHPLFLNVVADENSPLFDKLKYEWKLIGHFEDGLTQMRVMACQVAQVGAYVRVDIIEPGTDEDAKDTVLNTSTTFVPGIQVHPLYDNSQKVIGFKLGNKGTLDMGKPGAL